MTEYSEIAMPNSTTLHSTEATRFLTSVFAWMFVGLGITTLVSLAVSSSPAILQLVLGNMGVFVGLMIAELLLVVVLSAAINKLSASIATLMFLAYSALNGLTLSAIFLAYTGESILIAFLAAGCLFATMSLYGYATGRDLTSWGSMLTVGLIALIVCSIINIFIGSSGFDYILTLVGIVIFLGLTAYDTQKLLGLGAQAHQAAPGIYRKFAVIGALSLYLDFINLFLFMLRLFGRRK